MKNIPFNKNIISSNIIKNLKNLKTFSSGGLYQNKCEKWLEQNLKVSKALLTNSCTSALEICALLLDFTHSTSYK